MRTRKKSTVIWLTRLFMVVALVGMIGVQIPTAFAQEDVPSCGTDPVTLNAYFETGFDIPFALPERDLGH